MGHIYINPAQNEPEGKTLQKLGVWRAGKNLQTEILVGLNKDPAFFMTCATF